MIGIIDYGMGNLRSVANACKRLDVPYVITSDAAVLEQCDRLILPGVGSFRDCMQNIVDRGLKEPVQKMVNEGKPLLGICLGMQMLYESSEENGYTEGFGFLKGRIIPMQGDMRIPQIGWNELIKTQKHPLLDLLNDHAYMYYVHGFYASETNADEILAVSEYGPLRIPGLVWKKNVYGCQFHPEKSSTEGLKILSYFTKGELV